MLQDRANDFQIGLRHPRGNVVDRIRWGLVERHGDRATVVFNKKPITLLQPVAVDRKRLIFARVSNHEGDQFFWKLKWPKIVGAAQDDRGHPMGVGVGGDEMLCGSLACGVRAARTECYLFRETFPGWSAAVDLVGADV